MNYITEYWKEIEGGKCVVSRRVRKVYEQLARRIEQPEAGGRYIFDEKKALRPIEFIERFCKHSKGEWAGKPVTLELFKRLLYRRSSASSIKKPACGSTAKLCST